MRTAIRSRRALPWSKFEVSPLFMLLPLLLLLSGPACAGTITAIQFLGNEVTAESVMRREMVVREGDAPDPKRIEQSRQAIMNLGLFKRVIAELEEDGFGGEVLVITVEERYFLLPLPLLDVRVEGDYSYGIEVRHDNLFGLNQRLKLTYEHKESIDGDVPLEKQSGIKYTAPRIAGTAYQLGIEVKQVGSDNVVLEEEVETGSYHEEVNSGSFFLSRWVQPDWISMGWQVGAGLGTVSKHYSGQAGSAEVIDDSQVLAFNAAIRNENVQEYPYHREGGSYGYTLSIALPRLGSDYSFTRHLFYHQRYQPLSFVDANLNTQLQLGLANGQDFGSPAYSLGNSELLRGYDNDYTEGNSMLLLNVEYHHHLSGYRQLRGVLFTDIGNTWPSVSSTDLTDLLSSVGVGLRWRVQSFVNLTLRIDTAYAINAGTTKAAFTTSASF